MARGNSYQFSSKHLSSQISTQSEDQLSFDRDFELDYLINLVTGSQAVISLAMAGQQNLLNSRKND